MNQKDIIDKLTEALRDLLDEAPPGTIAEDALWTEPPGMFNHLPAARAALAEYDAQRQTLAPSQAGAVACTIRLAADDWNPYELLDIARLYVEGASGLEAGDELFIERIRECLRQQKRTQGSAPPGDLSARLREIEGDLNVSAISLGEIGLRGACIEARDKLHNIIAALSALPAAGGGCGDHDHADYIPGCPKCALTLPEKHTTPQPSAAEGDEVDPNDCPYYSGGACTCGNDQHPWLPWHRKQEDAAVGAQGDEVVIGATRCYGDDNWFRELTARGVTFLVPLDQQDKARHALAAPAAGNGVDAVRKAIEAVPPGYFNPTGGHTQTENRAAVVDLVTAALTRQPVAGDGWRPIESAPREKLVLLANEHNGAVGCGHMDARGAWWWSHHPTHWQPLLAAPAATPTDGGER